MAKGKDAVKTTISLEIYSKHKAEHVVEFISRKQYRNLIARVSYKKPGWSIIIK